MYRDDPLDDEAELRVVIGDAAVDRLGTAGVDPADDPVGDAVDVLRVLQGWMGDDAAGEWFHRTQRRLGDRTPVDALAEGDGDDVLDAARAFAAAQG